MLIRNPIVVPTNMYQQITPANKIHMAGWRAGKREISEGRDYFPANITSEATPRDITCRQNTRLFLYASKRTRTLEGQQIVVLLLVHEYRHHKYIYFKH